MPARLSWRVVLFSLAAFSLSCVIKPAIFEICDDGQDNDDDGQSDCQDDDCSTTVACVFCGNNTVDTGEICDDGNTNAGDGCRADCLGQESCGDGLLDGSEECDNGVANGGAACNATCQITGTQFISFAPVGGEEPDLAINTVFGEAAVDTDGDTQADSQLLLVVASNDPDPCGTIQTQGLGNFLLNIFGHQLDGEFVTLFASQSGQTGISDTIQTLTGDAQDPEVDAGFSVVVGGTTAADTLFGGDRRGILRVIDPQANTLKGNYDGVQKVNLAVDPPEDLSLNFQGGFIAGRCADIEIQMQAAADLLFSL